MIAQQLDISFIRTAVPWHRTLQRRQRTYTLHCMGQKEGKHDAFVFLGLEYASFFQLMICPRDILTSKWILSLGHFYINVRNMMEIWKVKQTKKKTVFGDLLCISLCSRRNASVMSARRLSSQKAVIPPKGSTEEDEGGFDFCWCRIKKELPKISAVGLIFICWT